MSKPGYWERQFLKERDRRYTEGKQAVADQLTLATDLQKTALDLAVKHQDHYDQMHNNLSQQAAADRAAMATKVEMESMRREIVGLIGPLTTKLAQDQGGRLTKRDMLTYGTFFLLIIGVLIAYYSR